MNIKDKLRKAKGLQRYFAGAKYPTYPIPFAIKLYCWWHGFMPLSYYNYELNKNDRKLYVNDYQRYVRTMVINKYHSVIDSKLEFYALFKNIIDIPKNYAAIYEGCILPLETDPAIDSPESLYDFVRQGNKIILKQGSGGGGFGVLMLQVKDGDVYCNHDKVDLSGLKGITGKLSNYIVCKYLEQHKYATEIFPKTLNTIRILTMIDPDNGEPFIAAATHRFGSEKSFPVDNLSQGGYTAYVDVKTGILGTLVGSANPEKTRMTHHPDTNAPVDGVPIPRWNEVCERLLELSEKVRFLKYVGWDVAITEDGFSIVEGNNYTDLAIFQDHKPLLTNQRIKNFFIKHKIIQKKHRLY